MSAHPAEAGKTPSPTLKASEGVAAVSLNGSTKLTPPPTTTTKSSSQGPTSDPSTWPNFIPTPGLNLDDSSITIRFRMIHHLKSLQTTICSALEAFEPTARFASSYSVRDAHEGFSDGRVLAHGETFEKAGCNISVTHSVLNPQMVHQMKAERFEWWDGEAELPFFVASISCVIHPHNPHAPTTHFNYRYFEVMDPTEPKGSPKAWWFAGGTDLTPSYLYDDDARLFHGVFKTECDKHNPEYYPAFKKWCDKYFYIPHRRETRGIGGIFFDDLADGTPEELFRFVRDCSNAFLPAYFPLVERRRNQAFSEGEKEWQQIRRGHYVEFNLMIDRGTKFGLAMKDPRTESILVSMPLTARWQYEPVQGTVEGSPEKRLMDVVQNPVEWV